MLAPRPGPGSALGAAAAVHHAAAHAHPLLATLREVVRAGWWEMGGVTVATAVMIIGRHLPRRAPRR